MLFSEQRLGAQPQLPVWYLLIWQPVEKLALNRTLGVTVVWPGSSACPYPVGIPVWPDFGCVAADSVGFSRKISFELGGYPRCAETGSWQEPTVQLFATPHSVTSRW